MMTQRISFAYKFSIVFSVGIIFLILAALFSSEGRLGYFFWIGITALLLSVWYGFMAILEWLDKISNT